MRNQKVLNLCRGGIIAALYVVLTLLANALGLANNLIQVRFSEALTILPYFTSAAIPGLFAGCLISNLLTGAALIDVVFGSVATLIGAALTFAFRKKSPWLAPLFPILSNTIIVPFILLYAYEIKPLRLSFITVGAGEIISCGVLGMLLLFALKKRAGFLFD